MVEMFFISPSPLPHPSLISLFNPQVVQSDTTYDGIGDERDEGGVREG